MSTDARVSRFYEKKGSQKISLDCPFKYSPTQMSFVHPYEAVLKSKNAKGVALVMVIIKRVSPLKRSRDLARAWDVNYGKTTDNPLYSPDSEKAEGAG